MSRHLHNEIERIKRDILQSAAIVEDALAAAIRALKERNIGQARRIIDNDARIDRMEVDLEEKCLMVLALHQPVAVDLRFLVAVLKINNDLERIADLAVNISERTAELTIRRPIAIPFDIDAMASMVATMLKQSLDALVEMDADIAETVLSLDDHVDRLHRDAFRQVQDRILEDATQMEQLIQYLSVSRNLERIGDLATNIAEDVIYMINGNIVRHRQLHREIAVKRA